MNLRDIHELPIWSTLCVINIVLIRLVNFLINDTNPIRSISSLFLSLQLRVVN
jgi:hypothetical protein